MARLSGAGEVSIVEELPVVTSENFATAEPQPTTLYSTVMEYPLFEDESEVRRMDREGVEGIFILPSEGDIKTVEDVQNLFSDEVSVVFSEDADGVIEYKKNEGEVVEYPFVTVPVSGVEEERNKASE